MHVIVEADDAAALTRGIQGLGIRVAKAINRMLHRRGRVWADRFHARLLCTPREVRNALVYVLTNFKNHLRGAGGLDPRSSAASFTGWRSIKPPNPGTTPVVSPRTWLAAVGWRRHGLIDVGEGPCPTPA